LNLDVGEELEAEFMEFWIGPVVLQCLQTGTMKFAPELTNLSERGTSTIGHIRPPDHSGENIMLALKS
jgi:hypothetical protein